MVELGLRITLLKHTQEKNKCAQLEKQEKRSSKNLLV